MKQTTIAPFVTLFSRRERERKRKKKAAFGVNRLAYNTQHTEHTVRIVVSSSLSLLA
jgi:hypothetical protein